MGLNWDCRAGRPCGVLCSCFARGSEALPLQASAQVRQYGDSERVPYDCSVACGCSADCPGSTRSEEGTHSCSCGTRLTRCAARPANRTVSTTLLPDPRQHLVYPRVWRTRMAMQQMALAVCLVVFGFLHTADALQVLNDDTLRGKLLLHVHLPKGGGYAFSNQLEKMLPGLVTKCKVEREYGINYDLLIRQEFNEIRAASPNCNFWSYEGGLQWMREAFEAVGVARADILPLIFFREPLAMRISGLLHYSRYFDTDPHGVIAAEQRGEPHVDYPLRNYQARALVCPKPELAPNYDNHTSNIWCAGFNKECPGYSVDRAVAALHSAFWVGVVEHYDASMCVLAYQLGAFNAEKCDCRKRSGTERVVQQLNSAPQGQRREATFSVEELKAISAMNADDYMVHSFAMVRFRNDVRDVERATGVRLLCSDDECAVEIGQNAGPAGGH